MTIFHFEELNIRIRVSEKEKVSSTVCHCTNSVFKWDKEEATDVDAVALVFSTVDSDVSSTFIFLFTSFHHILKILF